MYAKDDNKARLTKTLYVFNLRYLRSIVNKDLMYRSNESSHLIEYLNLDYAVDRVNRKFILEYAYAI